MCIQACQGYAVNIGAGKRPHTPEQSHGGRAVTKVHVAAHDEPHTVCRRILVRDRELQLHQKWQVALNQRDSASARRRLSMAGDRDYLGRARGAMSGPGPVLSVFVARGS